MEDREPGRYQVGHVPEDEDMGYYVYRQRGETRVLVAENLYQDDARFIAACYTHLATALDFAGGAG